MKKIFILFILFIFISAFFAGCCCKPLEQFSKNIFNDNTGENNKTSVPPTEIPSSEVKPEDTPGPSPEAGEKVDQCEQNIKNISTALEMYDTDYNEYPPSLDCLIKGDFPYMKRMPSCPSAGKDTYSESYLEWKSKGGEGVWIYCKGHNHKDAGLPENYPAYSREDGIVEPEGYDSSEQLSSSSQEGLVICEDNLRMIIAIGLEMYCTDNNGAYPLSLDELHTGGYLKKIPECPVCKKAYIYSSQKNPDTYILKCGGEDAHLETGMVDKGFYPVYTPENGLLLKGEILPPDGKDVENIRVYYAKEYEPIDAKVGDIYNKSYVDLNGDGKDEEIQLKIYKVNEYGDWYTKLIVMDSNGRALWSSPESEDTNDPMVFGAWMFGVCLPEVIGDINNDGFVEVVTPAPVSDVRPPFFNLLRWENSEFVFAKGGQLIETSEGVYPWTTNGKRSGRYITKFLTFYSDGTCDVKIYDSTGGNIKIGKAKVTGDENGFYLTEWIEQLK